ncbi:MFS transporter [Parasutterella secunda]|uniref:MFS transporter n=1 Tax=Parasutterella secunda TaxID=626947 RepID=A0ABS2GT49_9BURK|nr:MFS transporter [Parasutterella secunda]
MSLFSAQHLKAGVSGREVWSWAAFDFANSGYTTVVLTAVFNAYFVGVICGEASWATLLWTSIIAASNILAIVCMPLIGAATDLKANKKFWTVLMSLLCILGTVGLAFTGSGTVWLAVIMVIVSNFAYNIGETLNSAFLPEIADEKSMGKVSGWGWSFGYCGGLLTLGLSLAVVLFMQSKGAGAEDYVPYTMIITAAVFLVAALPLALWLKERAQPRTEAAFWTLVKQSQASLIETFKSLPQHKNFAWLVASGLSFQGGIAVVVTLAAVYADQAMGFTPDETILLVLLVNITAAIGAFAFGYVEDRIGHKNALIVTLLIWIAMVGVAYFAQTKPVFWIAANLAGIAMGSSQSAGRALVGVLAPPKDRAAFYSFWNMALWVANIIGPMTYGYITWLTDNDQRLALLCTGLFFVVGLILLLPMQLKHREG